MTTTEFRQAFKDLGVLDPSLAAATLGIQRDLAWRIWHGERHASPRVIARLEAAQASLPRALTTAERRMLLTAARIGDVVTEPVPRSGFDAGGYWEPTRQALRKLRLIKRHGDDYILTRNGAKAVAYFLSVGILV